MCLAAIHRRARLAILAQGCASNRLMLTGASGLTGEMAGDDVARFNFAQTRGVARIGALGRLAARGIHRATRGKATTGARALEVEDSPGRGRNADGFLGALLGE